MYGNKANMLVQTFLQRHIVKTSRLLHYNAVIIGGGVMGSSIAYFLKSKDPDMKIAVVERDKKYTLSASAASVSSIRQQFSNMENVKLSQWSHQFMCKIPNLLAVDEDPPPDIHLVRSSYMFLATNNGKSILENNCKTQRSCGADVKCFSADQLIAQFPWLNTDGIEAGSYCFDEKEGWFDGWGLLTAFKNKNKSIGVDYIFGDCINFDVTSKINAAIVKRDNELATIHGNQFLNAAGPWAGYLMETIGVKLPVYPRKRYVFVIDCPNGPGRSMPMLIDPTGVFCRPDGNGTLYLCGASPSQENEPDIADLHVDYDYFDHVLWPIIANRVPAMEELKVKHSWAGYYDYNTLDQNAIIGKHTEIDNLYFANGFSGHGIQQSPAVGNAISELILDGKFTTIDLTKLGYDRITRNEPFNELNII